MFRFPRHPERLGTLGGRLAWAVKGNGKRKGVCIGQPSARHSRASFGLHKSFVNVGQTKKKVPAACHVFDSRNCVTSRDNQRTESLQTKGGGGNEQPKIKHGPT